MRSGQVCQRDSIDPSKRSVNGAFAASGLQTRLVFSNAYNDRTECNGADGSDLTSFVALVAYATPQHHSPCRRAAQPDERIFRGRVVSRPAFLAGHPVPRRSQCRGTAPLFHQHAPAAVNWTSKAGKILGSPSCHLCGCSRSGVGDSIHSQLSVIAGADRLAQVAGGRISSASPALLRSASAIAPRMSAAAEKMYGRIVLAGKYCEFL